MAETVLAFRPYPGVLGFGFVRSVGAYAAFVRTGRQPGGLLATSLVLLDVGSLATIDSIALPPPFDDPIQVVAGPDPDLLFRNWSRIFAYSRVERRVVASVSRSAIGDLAIAPDGQLLAAGDMGTWPGSLGTGKIYFYSSALARLGAVDLTSSTPAGVPILTVRLAFSLDSRRLFAGAGTGPYFGSQPSQVLVIDTNTLELVRAIPLGGVGAPIPFPLR